MICDIRADQSVLDKPVLILDRPVGLRNEHETVELFRLDRSGNRAQRVTVEAAGTA